MQQALGEIPRTLAMLEALPFVLGDRDNQSAIVRWARVGLRL